jgi:hypothetical protein
MQLYCTTSASARCLEGVLGDARLFTATVNSNSNSNTAPSLCRGVHLHALVYNGRHFHDTRWRRATRDVIHRSLHFHFHLHLHVHLHLHFLHHQ